MSVQVRPVSIKHGSVAQLAERLVRNWEDVGSIPTSIHQIYGVIAQLVRAPALQVGGQEFNSPWLHYGV